MRPSLAFAVLTLLVTVFPSNLHAREALLDDNKIGPPGRCTQQFLGFHDQYGRMGRGEKPAFIALNDIDGRRFSAGEAKDDSWAAWALRAQQLKATLAPSDWRRLENSWERYVSARAGAAMSVERVCTGEELASSFGVDLLYLVGAPFEIAGAIGEGADGNGKEMFTYIALPVGAAIGLATDTIFTITLPVTKASVRLRAYRAARAFKRFTLTVAELEGLGGPSRNQDALP